MPTYEYQCKACKAVYELRQGFDAEVTHTCEECGKGIAKRILSTPAVVFKGGGWYATDSRGSKSAVESGSKSDSGESKSDSGTSETKTDAKPAAKSESKSEVKSTSSENAAS